MSLDEIEIVTVDLVTRTVGTPVPLDGPSGVPQLAGGDTGAYLVWTDATFNAFGATLSADNTLGAIASFGQVRLQPFAIDDRFLVVETSFDRLETSLDRQQARWIEADGTVGATFDFPGALARPEDQGAAASGGGVAATMFRRDNAIFVARTTGPDVQIADDAGMGSLVVLPDGTILAIYGKLAPTGNLMRHIVRIEADGTTTDEVIELPYIPKLVATGDRVFAISKEPSSSKFQAFSYLAFPLDSSGAVIGEATEIFELDEEIKVSMFSYQRDLVALSAGGDIEALHFDGAPQFPILVASTYEIDDGGCSSSGGASLAIALALLGIRRRNIRVRTGSRGIALTNPSWRD